MHYHMALATDSISIWLRYEVKYSMLLRPVKTEGVWPVTPLYMVA